MTLYWEGIVTVKGFACQGNIGTNVINVTEDRPFIIHAHLESIKQQQQQPRQGP
jgi:hypothetical protein